MKIEKYKFLGNGRYQIVIDGVKYIIYEDIILKYNILSKNIITKNDLDNYLKDNVYYEAYYKAVKYIEIKLRSEFELKKYLVKFGYDENIVLKVINALKKDGYLNEEVYVEAYINDQINLKNVGPLKIVKDLEKIGISSFVIDKYIGIYSKEEQIDKIEKLVKKEIKLNNNKSSYVLKNKILVSLFNKGFYKEDIVSVLNGCDIDDESVMKREYDKLYKKLSNKYSGNELLYKVKQKMYQKGFKI